MIEGGRERGSPFPLPHAAGATALPLTARQKVLSPDWSHRAAAPILWRG